MKNETVRLNMTVRKESYDVFRAQAASVNLRPGAFFDVLMSVLGTQSDDQEKLVGKFIMEVITHQSK